MLQRIEVEHWERKEHFEHYTKVLPCGYSITAQIDVTKLLLLLKERSLRFYPVFVWGITETVNRTKEFKMGLDAHGNPGFWDFVNPVHTVFHQDDKTFSDIWTQYDSEFQIFYENLTADIEEYKDVKGMKAKPGQPENFFCISCIPWLSYTGHTTNVPGGVPNLFPIIAFGKYEKTADGRVTIPVTVTISHAAADGYHTCKFFNDLQERVDLF